MKKIHRNLLALLVSITPWCSAFSSSFEIEQAADEITSRLWKGEALAKENVDQLIELATQSLKHNRFEKEELFSAEDYTEIMIDIAKDRNNNLAGILSLWKLMEDDTAHTTDAKSLAMGFIYTSFKG